MKDLFGKEGKCKLTGFTGIITACASYITGCDQIFLQPGTKDGAFVEGRWFDAGRIEVTGGDGVDPSTLLSDKNGCDISAPIK